MNLSTDIQARYRNRQLIIPNCDLKYKTNKTPQKQRIDLKPKITAELEPLIKRLQKLEKTYITKKDAEKLIESRLAGSEKQNKKQHDALYDKLRGL